MKIGFDGYEANIVNRVGSGQYAYQMLNCLAYIDPKNDYTVFLPSPPLPDMPKVHPRWNYVIGKPGRFWTIRELPSLIKKTNLDIFFSPTHYAPLFVKLPKIIAIMDLSYIHYPDMFKFKDLIQLKLMTSISIKNSRKVFTISEFSKTEIIKHYQVNPDDILVTYPGLTVAEIQKHSETSANIRSLTQNQPYILFVGTIQPRKNIVRLIEAFELLTTDHKLVIVGKKGWQYEPTFTKISKSVKSNQIVYLDYVNSHELFLLYQNAGCLVLPSLYEGFGIPVLEAMIFGCPVVVSKTTSLPEVAGNLGIYINPLDIHSIAHGLTQALQLTGSARTEYSNKSKVQAAKFSWEKSARLAISVFNEFKF